MVEALAAPDWIAMLRCPQTGQPLRRDGAVLVTADGRHRYEVTPAGIPLLTGVLSDEARTQQQHYDRIAGVYLDNLTYPHTQEYMAFLDDVFKAICPRGLGSMAEICCGAGEGFALLGGRYDSGIGVDVSRVMLEAARAHHPDPRVLFVQGDATAIPLADDTVDTVVMLGGIHHVNERAALFAQVRRILKPGGLFLWREPVDDFFLWRWLRALVYRLSPTLDADTEHPIRKAETVRHLERAGLVLQEWRTAGFLGYCVLMNSDVLVVTRAFKYLPGVRRFTRGMCAVDQWMLSMPGLGDAGLIAVGAARKPA